MVSVGSVSVDVVPSAKGWVEKLRAQLLPAADRAGSEAGEVLARRIGEKGSKAGDEFGGKFSKTAKARIEAALKSLPTAKIDVATTAADQKLKDLRAEMQSLLGKNIGIDISDVDALAKIDEFKLRLDELAAKSPSIQVKVDTLAASAQLLAFRAELAALDGGSVGGGLAASFGEAAAATGPLIIGIAAIATALIPVVASAAGLAAALVLPLAAAGGGLTIFGFLAGKAISNTNKVGAQIDALKKKAESLNSPAARAAALAQAKALEASLTGPQKAFLAAKKSLSDAFKSLTSGKSGDALFAPIVAGMNLLAKVMPALSPVIQAVSSAITGLLDSLSKSASGKGFTDFIAGFAKLAGSTITTAGNVIGKFGQGLFNIFRDFLPLSKSVGSGITDLANKFVAFSQKASTKKGIQDFINYVKANGPAVLSFFGNLIKTIVTVGKALAPIGSFMLKALTGVFKGLSRVFSGIDKNSAAVGRQFRAIGTVLSGVYNASIGPVFKYILKGVGFVIQGFGKLFDVIGKIPGSKFQWARDAAKSLHDAGQATKDLGDKLGHIPTPKPIKPTVNSVQATAASKALAALLRGLDVLHPQPKVSIKDAASAAIKAIQRLLANLKSPKPIYIDTYHRTFNINGGTKRGNLTAIGGVFNGAQNRIIGEAGPEAVVPLNRPLSQVDPAVRQLSAFAQGLRAPTQGPASSSGAGSSTDLSDGSIQRLGDYILSGASRIANGAVARHDLAGAMTARLG